jgi:sigma-B regulation protein RsbU (phosphoserine phosphatase)
MDSIFYLGPRDEKLPRFLEKLGYAVLESPPGRPITEIFCHTNVDLILLDGRGTSEAFELCTFLRGQEHTRQLPIVYITADDQTEFDDVSALDRIDIVSAPFSIGAVASRIATQLRLRKFAGQDELKSTLAEMNAALRDFNERFKRELQEAREIQQSLLPPRIPSASGVQLAISYQPLDELGGDWYFADKDSSGVLTLQIADVTGHGLSAAFIASMVKLAMVATDKHGPDQLLKGMNRLLSKQMPSGKFVTMASCTYDPSSGRLQWARAGHPPGLLRRAATNQVEQLLGDGFAIGFLDDVEYARLETELEPGDCLLMFTDGLSEAQNRSGESFGLERLADALKRTSSHALTSEILTQVLDAFDLFRQERLVKDDVTLMVLKRTT